MIRRPTYLDEEEMLNALQARGHVVLKQGSSLECHRCGESWTFERVVITAGPAGYSELVLSDKIGDCS